MTLKLGFGGVVGVLGGEDGGDVGVLGDDDVGEAVNLKLLASPFASRFAGKKSNLT